MRLRRQYDDVCVAIHAPIVANPFARPTDMRFERAAQHVIERLLLRSPDGVRVLDHGAQRGDRAGIGPRQVKTRVEVMVERLLNVV